MPRGSREITLRFLAAPNDAGYSGTVGGGRVMEWIDKAGYAAAAGWSGTYSVTAYAIMPSLVGSDMCIRDRL